MWIIVPPHVYAWDTYAVRQMLGTKYGSLLYDLLWYGANINFISDALRASK